MRAVDVIVRVSYGAELVGEALKGILVALAEKAGRRFGNSRV
jgi:hypothetical protein